MPMRSCVAHISAEVLCLHLSQRSDWMGPVIPRHDLKVTHASLSANVGTQWALYTEAPSWKGETCSNGLSPKRRLTLNTLRLAQCAGVLSTFTLSTSWKFIVISQQKWEELLCCVIACLENLLPFWLAKLRMILHNVNLWGRICHVL